ncbi:MAG: ABC transporter permease [Dehalococcoidia bacterium]|nr:MAG: ABC transporter permease [Dehalococcoidia bacterium]
MNKTFLIIKHEFSILVKRKGFIIMTLVFPLLALTAIGIHQIIQGLDDTGPTEKIAIGYVDKTNLFNINTPYNQYELIEYITEEQANKALIDRKVDEYVIIPSDYINTGVIERYTQKKELEPSPRISWVVKDFLLNNLIEGYDNKEIQLRIKYPLSFNTFILDEVGNITDAESGFSAFILPAIFGFLLIMAIGSASGYLLQGLGEEKENRIMEILLSSVSTRQLLVGKVIGLGVGGLLQIVLWLISAVFIIRLASNTIGGMFNQIQIPENFILIGIVYFILGYLFFAVLEAGIGAISPTTKESQQMTVALILPAILPFYIFIFFLRDNADHVIGTIFTLIPVTAPMMVFIRLGMSEIPVWELLLSVFFLIMGILGGLWLAAKLFRVYLLMYGKAPKVGEIFLMLKQS